MQVLSIIFLVLSLAGFSVAVFYYVNYRSRKHLISSHGLRSILGTIGEGLYVVNNWGRVTHINPAAVKMLGFSEKEVLGKSAHYLFHAHPFNNLMPLTDCPVYKSFTTGQPEFITTETFCRKDGTVFSVRLHARPLYEKDDLVGSVATFEDITTEVTTQQALRETKERLELVLSASETGLWDIDAASQKITVDFSSLIMLGYTGEKNEVPFNFWVQLVHPDDRERIRQHFFSMNSQRDVIEDQYRFRKANGGWLWLEVRGKVLVRDENGKAVRILGTVQNINERKKNEILIKEQEKLLRSVYDVLPVGITVTDEAGWVIDANKASEKLFGVTKEELLASNYAGKEWQILRPDGSPMPTDEYASVIALREKQAVRDVVMGIVKSDTITWISVSAMPIDLPGYGVVIAYVDISEQVQSQKSLRKMNSNLAEQIEHEVVARIQSDEKFRVLFNSAPDAIFVHGFDKNGRPGNFLEINDAACQLLGVTHSEARSMNPDSMNIHRSQEETMKLAEILRTTGKLDIEETVVTADGEEKHTLTMARMIRMGNEDIIITVVHDMTEVKKLQLYKESQQALFIQQSKMAEMGTMIGAIAHQWKQPLNSISIIAQDLPESMEFGELDEAHLNSSVERILRQIRFLSDTIESFRSFFKPSKDRVTFSLADAIKDVVKIFEVQLQQDGVKLDYTPSDECRVFGYPNEFKQVILNIINNARDVFRENNISSPRIHIQHGISGEKVVLELRDNGGGIPQEFLPGKLFEIFSTSKGDSGTGIGLYLAREIIKKIHGSIEAFNESDGAVFRIVVPLAKENVPA